jgi:magnesium chelatase accessory protein
LLAWRANDPSVVDELLGRTGSRLRPDSAARYRQLFRSPGHVGGALGMMANWDLESLQREWPKIRSHVLLVAAALDAMVPADEAQRLLGRLPNASAVRLKGLGHLAHEEAPELIARLVLAEARGEEPVLDPAEGRVLHEPADDRRISA